MRAAIWTAESSSCDSFDEAESASAVITAATITPLSYPLKIITDSKYVIEGMTTHLSKWEDRGWIGICNTQALKKAAFTLKK
jgi:ribonuclease HI